MSAHGLSREYDDREGQEYEEGEDELLLEHIITSVLMFEPKRTHVFTSRVISRGNLFVVRLEISRDSFV